MFVEEEVRAFNQAFERALLAQDAEALDRAAVGLLSTVEIHFARLTAGIDTIA